MKYIREKKSVGFETDLNMGVFKDMNDPLNVKMVSHRSEIPCLFKNAGPMA